MQGNEVKLRQQTDVHHFKQAGENSSSKCCLCIKHSPRKQKTSTAGTLCLLVFYLQGAAFKTRILYMQSKVGQSIPLHHSCALGLFRHAQFTHGRE